MKKRYIAGLLTLTLSAAVPVVGSTLAWFDHTTVQIDMTSITGQSEPAFFAYGNGFTEETAYGINTPRHLYNLAWLQYLGFFDKDIVTNDTETKTPDGKKDQYYFEIDSSLTTSLNMSGWVLPPIGTETHPFIGFFNGNGKTITNLTISNEEDDLEDNMPNSVSDYSDDIPRIVGFFGVVGDLNETTATVTPSMEDVTLDNLTVKSTSTQTLIGLAAGYVNGTMSGVKVSGNSTIDLNDQTHTSLNITNKLSDYGLVGYTTSTGSSGGTYKQKLSEYYKNYSDDSGGGDDDDWGGSFNSMEYNSWIYTLFSAGQISGAGKYNDPYTKSVSGDGGYVLKYTASAKTNPKSSQVVNRMRDDTYLPLKFSNENKTQAALSNTGYIAGVNIGTGTSVNGSPKISSYKLKNIGNSLGNTAYGVNNYYETYKSGADIASVDDSKVEILTYSVTSSSWVRLLDTHNSGNTSTNTQIRSLSRVTPASLGFEKYDASRDTLQSIFTSSGNQVHGIKFDTEVSAGSVTTIPANTARLNGATISSTYQVPKGAVDFNLKKTGIINMFSGAYNSGGTSSNKVTTLQFFSLYEVNRTGGTLNSVSEISIIYRNKYWNKSKPSDKTTNPKYFYKYKSGSFSNVVVNGTTRAAIAADRDTTAGNDGIEFDIGTVLRGTCPVRNIMYYFEIPVNNGEYALGAVSGSSYQGSYLIYLDIGANGDTVETDKVDAYHISTYRGGSLPYPTGVDFIPLNTITGDGGESICVSIASSKKGTLIFAVSSAVITVTDSSSICSYAYQGTKYRSSEASGYFTVSGLTGSPPGASTYGERVMTILLETRTEDDPDYVFRITDYFTDNLGTFDPSDSLYEVDSGSGFSTTTQSAIEALSNDSQIDVDALRDNLVIVATLTRASGAPNEFSTTYDSEISSYDDKITAVNVNRNGTTIDIEKLAAVSDYTFLINGDEYEDGDTYPTS